MGMYSEYSEEEPDEARDIKEGLEIKIAEKPEEKPLPLWASKAGGTPYLPETMDYPRSRDKGEPALFLVAQINFEEIPEKLMLDAFPRSGILQWYTDFTDAYGLDYSTPAQNHIQKTFRVLYHPVVEKDEKKLWSKTEIDAVLDTVNIDEPPMEDHRADHRITFEYIFTQYRAPGEQCSCDTYGDGNQLGGWPYFCQGDPRNGREDLQEFTEVLCQIGCSMPFTWGECGIGGLLISKQDLAAHDFSRVLYYWDCI